MPRRLTKKEFIKRSKEVHSNKYDYSKVKYINNKTKVCIICRKHGEFWQIPSHHFSGSGCRKCYGNYPNDTTTFIKKAKKIHGNKYDYSKVKYRSALKKVEILCKIHGGFFQEAKSHLKGHGCRICYYNNNKLKYTNKQFIEICNTIFNNKYDYSKTKYVGSQRYVTIICPEHGEFIKSANSHLQGNGCPYCSLHSNKSKKEKKIEDFLLKNNIGFVYQKRFNEIKNLPFDFYLPEHNLIIEYDGIQHYTPVKFFGGEEYFIKLKNNDIIKNTYCKKNSINMLRISYNENTTEKLRNIV